MSILDSAELLLQAKNYSGSGEWLDESGNGHNAQLGADAGADTSDPLFKAFSQSDGQYVFMPGNNTNEVSTADTAALSIIGELDIRWHGTFDWTTAELVSKRTPGGGGFEYAFRIAAGDLELYWHDGAEFIQPGESTVAVPFSADEKGHARVTREIVGDDYVLTYYTSTDGATWTQLGDTTSIITASNTPVDSTALVHLNSQAGVAGFMEGDMYDAQIYDGIAGTLVFDANLADATEPFATFTERSSNAATVTINRSTTGLVCTVVDRDMFLLTTDDYFLIPDHDDLDIASDEGLTLMVMGRVNHDPANVFLLSKKANISTAAGYVLYTDDATGGASTFMIADGSNRTFDQITSSGSFQTRYVWAGVREIADDDIEAFRDGGGSGSPTTDISTSGLDNALALLVGALNAGSPSGFAEAELHAVVIWRYALTDAEILTATNVLTTTDLVTGGFATGGEEGDALRTALETGGTAFQGTIKMLQDYLGDTGVGYGDGRGRALGKD